MSNNNAKFFLSDNIIDVNSTTIPVPGWKIGLFSNTFPYTVTYEKTDADGVVTGREIMRVNSKSGNNLIVTRRIESCPVSDAATSQTQSSITLEAWGVIEARLTDELILSLATILQMNNKLDKGHQLVSSDDLNDKVETGFYYTASSATATSIANTAWNHAFLLLVQDTWAWSIVKQEFTSYYTWNPRVWRRTKYVNSWGAWREDVNTWSDQTVWGTKTHTGQIRTKVGTAASPWLWVWDDNSGLYDAWANEIGLSLDGILRILFSGSILNVKADSNGRAELNLASTNQGWGKVYMGQSQSHWWGIEYDGSLMPGSSGAWDDYVAMYRRSSGTDTWIMRCHYSNDYIYVKRMRYNDANIGISDDRDLINKRYLDDALSGLSWGGGGSGWLANWALFW